MTACVWCGKKRTKTKFCSAGCLREAFEVRDMLQARGQDRTLDDAIVYHSKFGSNKIEKNKKIKFSHYTSSAGRWEYI